MVGLAFTAGTLTGAVAGFIGGLFEDAVMRIVDIMMSFPAFILAMGITAVLGNTIGNVIMAIAIAYTPYFMRLTRGEMLKVRKMEYADAARCIGVKPVRILFYHLLPNGSF